MTDQDNNRPSRAKIRRGFVEVEVQPAGDDRVRVVKRKRRHKFGEGYKTVGPEREIWQGSSKDAALLADVLMEVFYDDV